MVKVLFIAYYFPPAGGAGVQRALKFVQYLPCEGYLPVVITGPTHSDYRWTPQDRTLMNSIPASVLIHRVERPAPRQAGRFSGRLEAWLSLPDSFSKWWIRSATEVGERVAKEEQLIFATMSPFQSASVAQRLSKRLGIPWVADLRDPWALDEMQVYLTGLHRRINMRRMERLLSSAALIIMNTPEASVVLKATFPSLRDKDVVAITNGFDSEDFSNRVASKNPGKFRIVHSGYLHTDSGLRLRSRHFYRLLGGVEPGVDILTRSHTVLLEAIERWCSERAEISENLEVLFAGQTSKEDRDLATGSRVARLLHFTGYLSHRDSVELIRSADLLFLPMHNLPPGKRSRIIPGKTYEYMAAGPPVLAAVPDGDARDYLSRSGAALICRPDDVQGMIQILDRVYMAWKRGESVVNRDDSFIYQFDRRNLTHALARAFDRVIPRDLRSNHRAQAKSEATSTV